MWKIDKDHLTRYIGRHIITTVRRPAKKQSNNERSELKYPESRASVKSEVRSCNAIVLKPKVFRISTK